MPSASDERKRRFEAALKLAGETMESWAQKQGISYGHLYFVLSGQRESARLSRLIEAFIADHLPPQVA
ncbi:hypothetical protein J421_4635 (plasmid) [Gemmatirosa kalamazoonensis]|uniref:Transcriptional regulator n=1 Tax=Gemmatirosa kalamazoonensis TaxID=861299 RepID=W0RP88_9BACT|nr:hypothetical protein [Gemmatirosa kalamazoonensis]AHG92102.1 hypothetical protein J421_4567 [Gemmatirosa kalamazoonensis]AHG92170.1 hypothetical protein J421_4635 [Gemmatirosa kalamazoonensis]